MNDLPKCSLAFAALTLAPAFISPQLFAQDSEVDVFELSPFEVSVGTMQGYNPEQSVGGTKIVADLRTLPLSVTVLTNDLIEDLAATSLEEALRFTTGVTAQQPAAAQAFSSLFIRGNETRFIYRDGFVRWRANEPFFIEQIEILKGPTAILYGQALPGGAINYASKRALIGDEDGGQIGLGVNSYGQYFANIDANVSTDDNLAVRLLGSFRQGGTFADYEDVDYKAWMAALAYRPTSTTRLTVNYEQIANYVDNPHVTGSIYWRGEDNRGSRFLSQDGRLGGGIGYHPFADEGTNPWGHPDLGTYVNQDTESLTIRLEQKIINGLYFRASYHTIDTISEGLFSGVNDTNPIAGQGGDASQNLLINSLGRVRQGSAGDTVTIGGNEYIVGNNRFLDQNTIAGVTPGAWFEGRQTVAVYRQGFGRGDLRFVGNDYSYPGLYNPNLIGPRGLAESFAQNTDDVYQLELTYEFDIADSTHRILVGYDDREGEFNNPLTEDRSIGGNTWNIATNGVAYNLETGDLQNIFGEPYGSGNDFVSDIIIDRDNRTLDGESGSYAMYTGKFFNERLHILAGYRITDAYSEDTNGVREEFDNESPQFGALFQVTDNFGFFASQSESFLLTNARFTSIAPGAENPDAYVPGAPFPPQQGTGLDIGVKFDFEEPRVSGSLTYFEITHDQIPITDRDVFDELGNNVRFPGGENNTTGVELEVFYSPTPQWQIKGGITWLDAKYGKVDPQFAILEGLRLTQSAEWQGSIWVRYSFDEGFLEGLSLGGGANYLGERLRHIHTPTVEWLSEARTVIDVFARYRKEMFGQDIEVGMNIQNLTDEFYDSQLTRAYPGIHATFEMTVYF